MKNETPLVVRPWSRQEDTSLLRRFWYDVYVREMGRHVDTADHVRRELHDERANVGEVIVALKGDRVVGTLICTASSTGALGAYESLYNMDAMGEVHPVSTALITKFMVASEYRSTTLSLRLSCELYRHAVPRGVYHPVIDCNDHLVPLFERLGFTRWGACIDHPDYGRVNVLTLACLDLKHLAAVRSPLLPLAREIVPRLPLSQPSPTQGVLA